MNHGGVCAMPQNLLDIQADDKIPDDCKDVQPMYTLGGITRQRNC